MIQMLRSVHWSGYAVGALLGAVIMFGIGPNVQTWDDIYWRTYDEWNPVATITARKLPSPEGQTLVELTVIRHRGDECEVVKMAALEILPNAPAERVFAARADGQLVMNVPVGVVYRSVWRFWPTGVGELRAAMEYKCHGRTVRVEVRWLT